MNGVELRVSSSYVAEVARFLQLLSEKCRFCEHNQNCSGAEQNLCPEEDDCKVCPFNVCTTCTIEFSFSKFKQYDHCKPQTKGGFC